MPALVTVDHEIDVPLDHARPDGPRIRVFAREVADPDGRDRPFLVYLQGGPGFEAPRPTRHPSSPAWLDRALAEYRVLMLDQRGTGRSSPVTPAVTAAELVHYRADAIVADCEAFRAHLGSGPWTVLGQSFGGFTTLCYLSQRPEGLREALITGGLPPVGRPADDVYRATWRRVVDRSRRYWARYPEDRERFRAAVATAPRLASGDVLSHARLRQLGHQLGMHGGPERVHAVLELPPHSAAFAHDADVSGFGRNPLYAVVHESSYADGGVTGWSAQRTMPEEYAEDPLLLSGEHVFRWMFDEIGALTPYRAAAEEIAAHDWPRLYDADVLAANEVPVAAAVYTDDLYVERAFSEETAAQVRGLRAWITSEYEHNALRTDGARVLGHLLDLVRDRR